MSEELIEFYRARLDENEAAATAAGGFRWESDCEALKADHGPHGVEQIGEFWKVPDNPSDGYISDVDSAAHAARHDPARALREVEAGRKLIAAYEEASAAVDAQAAEQLPPGMPGVAQIGDATGIAQGLIEGYARAPGLPAFAALAIEVQNRAEVYSDHPDWRPEWLVAQE